MTHSSKYFYGNEVSEYGQTNGYVDYATLAKSFDAVMSNDIISATQNIGYWECENDGEYFEDTNGKIYDYDEAQERIEELEEMQNELDADDPKYDEIQEDIDALQYGEYPDIYQHYIVSDNGAEILKEAGEIVYYNETLDLYVWGVTHWGTSWDYVLTNIKLEIPVEIPTATIETEAATVAA